MFVTRLARVKDARYLGGYSLRLTFSDGLVRELDFEHSLTGPVFETVKRPEVFSRVSVDRVAGTIQWPNGVDYDPVILHGDAAPSVGSPPVLLSEHRLPSTG